MREVPARWRARGFERSEHEHRIRADLRGGVHFLRQDAHTNAPRGRFDLILCRNLAFTYFQLALQRDVLARLTGRLREPGYLVVGAQERLPDDHGDLVPAFGLLPVYRRALPVPPR